MEQLVLLLIIAAISLVNWLIEQSGKLREKRRLEKARADHEQDRTASRRMEPPPLDPEQPAPAEVGPPEEPERQLRRMLESFGFPVQEEETPPPPVLAEPPALPKPLPMPKPAVRARRRWESAPATSATTTAHPLVRDLRSREGLRRAIVLREILGPPKALATPDSNMP